MLVYAPDIWQRMQVELADGVVVEYLINTKSLVINIIWKNTVQKLRSFTATKYYGQSRFSTKVHFEQGQD